MKAYLARALEAEQRIESRMIQIGRLKALAGRGARSLPDDERGQQILSTMQSMEQELQGEIEAWRQVKKEVARVIEAAGKDSHRLVLTYRYLNGWEWNHIASRMNYSLDRVWHLHADAIRALQKERKPGTG